LSRIWRPVVNTRDLPPRTFEYVSATRRVQRSGCVYHVTSRGNLRAPIYLADEDRARFLGLVERACFRDGLICHAYCLMGNHYHLLVETPRANLGEAMHRINRAYAQQFNMTHEREGHVFERRYRAWVMRDRARQMEAVRYIVRNPVRAGLCSTPEEWPWSSHRATAGLRRQPPYLTVDEVHSWFGITSREAAQTYREFVAAGVDEPHEPPTLEQAIGTGTITEIAVANSALRLFAPRNRGSRWTLPSDVEQTAPG
jgi:putative transposase